MTRKKSDKPLEEYLRGDSPLSRAYRKSGREPSPPGIDAAILAEARRAVGASRRGWAPFGAAWSVPISAAAVIVLSVALVVFMSREGVTPTASTQAPPEAPAMETRRAADAADTRVSTVAKEKKLEKSAATGSAVPLSSADAPAPAPAPARAPPPALSEETAIEGVSRSSKTSPVATTATGRRTSADVVSVTVAGSPGAYRFNVGIKSADTGCDQYADWWEVIGEDGRLLYRHVLLHSHVSEQPFAREGGPVPIQPDTVVWIRAHMHPAGYGGVAFKGSPRGGFQMAELNPTFAATLAKSGPLPQGCDF